MALTDQYDLDRSESETDRLNAQLKIWTKNIGYLIHPSISIPKTARIADIATGTGAYLLELAKTLPSTCQLDGYDIADTQFPKSLPENVSLGVHDVRVAFPKELHGKYDFVHLSMLVAGMEKDDWALAAANVIQLLKPGGSIQWREPDLSDVKVRNYKSDTPLPVMNKAYDLFRTKLTERFKYGFSTLPAIFKDEGLRNVFQDVVSSGKDPNTRPILTKVSYDAIFGWASQLASKNVPGVWSLEELSKLRRQLDQEIAAGGCCEFEQYLTIGTL